MDRVSIELCIYLANGLPVILATQAIGHVPSCQVVRLIFTNGDGRGLSSNKTFCPSQDILSMNALSVSTVVKFLGGRKHF